jgi:hypothetical protein
MEMVAPVHLLLVAVLHLLILVFSALVPDWVKLVVQLDSDIKN